MLSRFSVRKPYTVVVAVIIIIILGVVSITNMSTDLLPNINLPYAVVATTYAGASPEEVEMVVTKPIEQRMAFISNIKNIRSISQENRSIVILEFGENTNMDSAIIEIRESLDMIKAFMPDQVGTSVIMKINPDMLPLMVVSAAVKGQNIGESSSFLESKVIPELESIEGVASVSASGLVDNQIHVILSEEKISEVNNKIRQAVLSSMNLGSSGEASISSQQALQQTSQQIQQSTQNQTLQMGRSQQQVPQLPKVPEIKITKEMVAGILKGQNFSMPAGYITEDGVDYLVRTGDKIKDLEELKTLTVMELPIPGMKPVTLQDVAEIVMFDNTGNRYSKVNGDDAIILTIQKQTEYTIADIAKRIRQRIADIMDKYKGVEIVPLMDQGEYIDIVVNSISLNLIIGGILAILVLLIFLRDLKPTIIIAVAIPVSLVTAFVMMYFGKITLNLISMGGLALGVGMLVDNSIVVIENIYRMRNEGKSPKEAAVEGAQQVAGAIIASTLTTVAVFVPILFTQGLTRQIFSDMGLTITFSLLASLIIALTLVPMMASGVLVKNIKKEHKIFDSIKRRYNNILEFSLRHKWIVILITLVLFVGSVIGAFRIGTELMPSSDTGQLTVNLSMQKGVLFEDITEAADKVMKIIMDIDDVETVGASMSGGILGMGGLGMGRSGTDSVSYYVRLKDDRTKSTDEIAQLIRDRSQSPDYEISVTSTGMDMTALSGGTIAINIKGRDFDTLEDIAKDVAGIVSSVEGTTDVTDGIEETAPELRIEVDKEKSIAKGLTVAQVFMEINKLLANETAATSISIGNKDYDVFVKDEKGRGNITQSDIINIEISTPQGEKVAIRDIAHVEEARGFSSINRTNQERYITVRAELKEGYNIGLVSNEISSKLAEYRTPEGYTIEMSGERRMINETFRDLLFMLMLAIAFIYLIMVAQFQSLLSPFIIMFTIPLAFTGGFLGLIVTGNPVSTVAFIGLIILAGVVVNNGIVFVDYINKMREEGMSKKDAIFKAGNDRIRPILMTALTTIFALSTMSMGAGLGTEMIQPMAITAIGGLTYATFLTLILIPVLYDSFHKTDKLATKDENRDTVLN